MSFKQPKVSTMKPPKTEKPPKVETSPDGKLIDQHVDAVRDLAENCMEVTYEVYGLPTTRTVSESARNKMVETVGGKRRGYSISKRMFISNHPLIKEFNAARRRLDDWRDSFVIVKAAEASTDSEGKEKITAGVRLIMAKDIAEFEQGFRVRVDEYYAAADQIQKYLDEPYHDGKKQWPSILDNDQAELGSDFNKADYPTDVRDYVRVVMPQYNSYAVSLKLPPEVRKRQEERIVESLNGTLETATSYICETLTDVFTTFANQLVNRTRLNPDPNGPFGKYHGAELVKLRTHAEDDTVPKGTVVPVVRYKDSVATGPAVGEENVLPGVKEVSVVAELDPIAEADYDKIFKPQTTEERKSLTKSVLDNLFAQLETVNKVRDMLGPYGEQLETTVGKIRELMSGAGKSSEAVLNEAKNSKFFRDKLAASLNNAMVELSETVETAKRVRRKINPKLIGLG